MKVLWAAPLVLSALVGACSKPNPEVCCLDPADCSSIGAHEDMRPCTTGLACVDHECVLPDCSKLGCSAAAPVCNMATDVCEGCTANADCLNFKDQALCDPMSGRCVQCLASTDCGPTAPYCEANTCRKCQRDMECASGACADDGTCLTETSIVYVDPAGMDADSCSKGAPCRTFMYALSKMTPMRNHLVAGFGGYVEQVVILPTNTAATSVVIHGGGASLSTALGNDGPTLTLGMASAVKELNVSSNGADAISANCTDGCLVERCRLSGGGRGISVNGEVTLRDVVIDGNGFAAILTFSASHLVIDRATIKGSWQKGIGSSNGNVLLDITNMLLYGATELAIDLPLASGSISFSTIADSGTDAGSGPRAVLCGPQTTIRSSIIWAPGGTPRQSVAGCNLATSIAGPIAVAGASNSDPQFANSVAGDYHLSPGSPARDVVEVGPAFDFEGTQRPRNGRFDLGADEAD